MAQKTIFTCDRCEKEMKEGEKRFTINVYEQFNKNGPTTEKDIAMDICVNCRKAIDTALIPSKK